MMAVPGESLAVLKSRTGKIVERLKREFPGARCSLDHGNAYELLVATILSAQCTDERVNLVTPELFRVAPSPPRLAALSPSRLEGLIRSTGFFRMKTRSLLAMARGLVEQHDGGVPRNVDELVELPGVGRKTANVIMGTAFGIPSGVAVDTHVSRLSSRLGLSRQKNPEKIAADLESLVPRDSWIKLSFLLIEHGRRTCTARRPACESCPVSGFCPSKGEAP